MARVLLGVCGGIAAYKSVELVRLAGRAGHSLRVLQTPSSLNFVGRSTFEGITGAPVLVDEFENDPARGAFPGEDAPDHNPINHLELVRRADVYCIAPATANTIAKLAGGQADNIVTSAYLACAAPVVIAPAMNNRMYEHPATAANLATLRERGVLVVDPEVGSLASKGEWGVGRLAEPARLLDAIEQVAAVGTPRPLDGTRVLVTAGGTREPLDSVRYLGNRSSGRMGFALADQAAARGADVTVIAANVALPRNPKVTYVEVDTAAQLRSSTLTAFEQADILLMAAAVADYRPERPADGKLSKEDNDRLELQLVRTDDVLSELAQRRREDQTVIGFAAEHGEHAIERAQDKLERKRLDAIVFNDISDHSIGFDSSENAVTIVSRTERRPIARAPKAEIAGQILDYIAEAKAATKHARTEGEQR